MEGGQDRRDPEAVRRVHGLFLSHIDVIRGFIRALVRDPHLADDVLQETFLTVAAKADRFEPGTNFPKWACAIARFKVLEARRREAMRIDFLSEDVLEALAAAHRPVVGDDRIPLLDQCLERLTPRVLRMMKLRYVSGCTSAEVAERVGWKVGAVYVALSRARTALRRCVEDKLAREGGLP